jgi:hypothetical protein
VFSFYLPRSMGILHAAMENGPFIHGLIGFTKIYL